MTTAAVHTLGAEAVDVLYLTDDDGRPLAPAAADAAVTAVRQALGLR